MPAEGIALQDQLASAQALVTAGRLGDAEAAYRRFLGTDPDAPEAWYGLGVLLARGGRVAQALEPLRRAVALRPDWASAHYNLGVVAQRHGLAREAADAYAKAIALDPDHAGAHLNLGTVLSEAAMAAPAVAHFERAIALARDDPNLAASAWVNLGNARKTQGRIEAARDAFTRAHRLVPRDGLRVKAAMLLPVIPASADAIEAARRDLAEGLRSLRRDRVRLSDPLSEVGSTHFNLAYHGRDDRDLQAAIARFYAEACPSLNFVAAHCAAPAADGPRRIGFVSRFLRDHSIGRLMANLIAHLATRGLRVVVFTFPQAPDPIWAEIEGLAEAAEILPLDLKTARQRIAAQRLDILVYPDIGMDPMTYFLAFARLAPVQCATWGHPVTTGIPTVDYFLSCDAAEPADADAHYSERLVRLKGLPMSYRRPAMPAPLKPRAAFGLEAGRTLYFCAQSPFKLHPEFDPMLAGILRADPDGQLLVLHGTDPHPAALLLARWHRTMPDVLDRLLILPRQSHKDYMNLLAIADVSLDSWPFCGGNTSYQALAVGTPVVTLPGAYLRGRLTLAIYRRMGIDELVAKDAADYVRISVRLGTDPGWRRRLRATIAARADAIFDDPEFLADAERFLTEVAPPGAIG